MDRYKKMAKEREDAFTEALLKNSREAALAALKAYLKDIEDHIYGTPVEVNTVLLAAIKAGLLTAEDIPNTNPNCTERLSDNLLSRADSVATELSLLLLPVLPVEDVIKAVNYRWCLKGNEIAQKIFPYVNKYKAEGQKDLESLKAAAIELMKIKIESGNTKDHKLLQTVLKTVERSLDNDLKEILESKTEIIEAAMEIIKEDDENLFKALTDDMKSKIFTKDSWLITRSESDITRTVEKKMAEVLGELSETLADQFDIEKPSFEEWSKDPANEEMYQSLVDHGLDVCRGVDEGSGPDTSKEFLIFEGWDQHNTLERLINLKSVDHGFNDEYHPCACGCNIAVRISPNSYSWQPNYITNEDGYLLIDCMDEDDLEQFVEEKINDAKSAINCKGVDVSKIGFKLVEDGFENGWHRGQDDNPEAILASLLKKNPKGEYLFVIDGTGQFDISFSVWARKESEE